MLSGQKEKCCDEIPAALTAIMNLESLSIPTRSDDIRFVYLYKLLSDLMKGYPVEELNPETHSVLVEAHEELMAAVNSPKGNDDLKKLENYFATGRYETEPIDENYKMLHKIMADPQWNPLNIPSEFLFNSPTVLQRK